MPSHLMNSHNELFEKVESLQNMLISYATGGRVDEDEYKKLREELLQNPLVKDKLPRLVRTHRDFKQFWGFIKKQSATYQGRREFLWDQFRSLLDSLEQPGSPA